MSANTKQTQQPSETTRTGMSTLRDSTSDGVSSSYGGTKTGMATLKPGAGESRTAIRAPSGLAVADATAIKRPAISRDEARAAMGDTPGIGEVRGFKLEQMLLLTTLFLVVAIVSLLAVVYAVSAQGQFEQSAELYKESLEEQARELGQTVSHTISLTSATQLRDNNFGFLGDVVRAIETENPNVLRVRIFDAQGRAIADSDENGEIGEISGREARRSSVTTTYNARPVFEYQEPVDYGSSAGKGIVVLTYSLEPLQGRLRELEAAKRETLSETTTRTVVLGLIFLGCATILAALQSRRITRPLGSLTTSVLQLAQGNFDARVESGKGASREVKTLGMVFNHMADRISHLMEDVRAKALLEREVQVARTVQAAMLPSGDVFPIGPVRLAGMCLTADACGGDWWLRTAIGQRRLVIGIGDVTGHGLSTALVATSATSGFAAAVKLHDPEQVNTTMLMSSLNQTMFLISRGEHQMSTGLAVLDLATGMLDYGSGAHPAPFVFNRNDGKVSSLSARGALLGSSEHSQYTSQERQLQPGDVIVWYTDGLTECRDTQEKMYGNKRLANLLRQYGYLPAEQIRDAIIEDVKTYTEGAEQHDDITIVVMEYSPGGVSA